MLEAVLKANVNEGNDVKLAEALVIQADHQKRLEQIKSRLNRNAKVQDGEHPAEDPALLISDFEAT
jgi:hypothetical protein